MTERVMTEKDNTKIETFLQVICKHLKQPDSILTVLKCRLDDKISRQCGRTSVKND
jgi:hypothetical protein